MLVDFAPLPTRATSPRWISLIFEAPLVPASSWYDFSLPANRDRNFLPLDSGSKYLISSMTISANVQEAAWLQGLPPAGWPMMMFGSTSAQGQWVRDPVSLAQYWRHGPMRFWYEAVAQREIMQLSVGGQVLSNPGLIGIDPLRLIVTLEIYQVSAGSFRLLSPILEATPQQRRLAGIVE